jgi:hypothetical protein
MRIRKLTKKMVFHKVKWFHAKKGNIMKKGAQHFHHKRFLHFKNEFHLAVSVRLRFFISKLQELKSKQREDRSFELMGALYKLAEKNQYIVDKIDEKHEHPQISFG